MQNCYIEFEISDQENFADLKHTFELIKEAKNSGQKKADEFWLANFADYSIKQFNFLDADLRPTFKTADKSDFSWHFYSLTSLLQTDYDVAYVSCIKLSEKRGRIEYMPFGYPYGGITGLVVFVASFNCTPDIIDDGTSLYQINYLANGDFSIIDLNDPDRQDSSEKRFFSIGLLKKFASRFK